MIAMRLSQQGRSGLRASRARASQPMPAAVPCGGPILGRDPDLGTVARRSPSQPGPAGREAATARFVPAGNPATCTWFTRWRCRRQTRRGPRRSAPRARGRTATRALGWPGRRDPRGLVVVVQEVARHVTGFSGSSVSAQLGCLAAPRRSSRHQFRLGLGSGRACRHMTWIRPAFRRRAMSSRAQKAFAEPRLHARHGGKATVAAAQSPGGVLISASGRPFSARLPVGHRMVVGKQHLHPVKARRAPPSRAGRASVTSVNSSVRFAAKRGIRAAHGRRRITGKNTPWTTDRTSFPRPACAWLPRSTSR